MENVQQVGEVAARAVCGGVAFDLESDAELRRFGVDPFKLKKMHDDAREAARRNEEVIARFAKSDERGEAEKEPGRWDPQYDKVCRQWGVDPDNLWAYYDHQRTKPGYRAIRPARRNAGYRPPAKLVFSNFAEWHEPVSAETIVPQLVQIIRRHAAMAENSALLAALWILHTHALDAFETSPRLAIRSAQPVCGKSKLLRLIALLVPRPLETCAASPRAILDSLGFRPTLLLDDSAALLRSTEICAILRNGRQRGGASLLRNTRGNTQNFDLFTPAALVVQGKTPALLAGRSIELRLEPLKSGETVLPLRDDTIRSLECLRSMAARWAEDHVPALRQQDLSAAQDDENWVPLLRIAASAGTEWEKSLRDLMQRMRAEPGSLLQLLLAEIRSLIAQRAAGELLLKAPNGKYFADRDRIRSADLVQLLGAMEGEPWCEWGKSAKPITPHALARLLAEANIRPATHRFQTADQTGPGSTLHDKGYLYAQFAEAFARYLPVVTGG